MGIEEKVKERGEYFGYPTCCVNYFKDNLDDMDTINTERKRQMGVYYGLFQTLAYTPCPKCYSVILRNLNETKLMYEVKKK